jgi:hypothetical protein
VGINEAGILNQAKKGQGETNDRLEALIKEQQLTNQWLARIAQLLEAQQNAAQAHLQRQQVEAQYPQRPAEAPPRGSWQGR